MIGVCVLWVSTHGEAGFAPMGSATGERPHRAMNVLVIVNDQPSGSERPYNALRLATALSKREGVDVRVFLLGDAVGCAVGGQQLAEGHYHLDRMLKGLLHRAIVGCCGTCLDARGLSESQLVDGARRSTLEEPTDRTLWAEKILTF
jgi:uncharacterized protein involved in oxidation of intracellular sulfur